MRLRKRLPAPKLRCFVLLDWTIYCSGSRTWRNPRLFINNFSATRRSVATVLRGSGFKSEAEGWGCRPSERGPVAKMLQDRGATIEPGESPGAEMFRDLDGILVQVTGPRGAAKK